MEKLGEKVEFHKIEMTDRDNYHDETEARVLDCFLDLFFFLNLFLIKVKIPVRGSLRKAELFIFAKRENMHNK